MATHIRIFHRPSNTLLAEGQLGWDITPFEGNYYVRKKFLNGTPFKLSAIPGLCFYKFIYLWLDLEIPGRQSERFLAWKYIIPNPLFPFIWFRTAIYGSHPDIEVRKTDLASKASQGGHLCPRDPNLEQPPRADINVHPTNNAPDQ